MNTNFKQLTIEELQDTNGGLVWIIAGIGFVYGVLGEYYSNPQNRAALQEYMKQHPELAQRPI